MTACKDCRFFDLDGDGPELGNGVCRRKPPTLEGRWPWTQIDDWCGEHRPKVGDAHVKWETAHGDGPSIQELAAKIIAAHYRDG